MRGSRPCGTSGDLLTRIQSENAGVKEIRKKLEETEETGDGPRISQVVILSGAGTSRSEVPAESFMERRASSPVRHPIQVVILSGAGDFTKVKSLRSRKTCLEFRYSIHPGGQ